MATVRSRAAAVAAAAALSVLAGCGPGKEAEQVALEKLPARGIYDRAEHKLEAENDPEEAARLFSEVERLYPYSDLVGRALVMQAFALHRDRDYEGSRAAAGRYLEFYPAEEDAAYAQYLIALSYYDQIEQVGRDQEITIDALRELRRVIEGYPESGYARTAKLKFDLAFNHLAGKEMEVGRFYLKRRHYTAAINRFQTVVQDFQTTTHAPEALYRLIEAYLSLGLDDEAQTAGAILAYNFRSSEWYQDGYDLLRGRGLRPEARGTGWLREVYRQTVKGKWL